MSEDRNTVLVVDGHSMAFRAFYALPVENFTARGGQATNAVYGFIAMLVKLLETESPSHVAVAFDLSRHSFRTDEYPEYKGTRDETPEDFKGQVEVIEDLLANMGICTLTKENYEADDILATLAAQGPRQGMRVLLASGDRDTFQLVTDDVTVLYPGRSASDLQYMTPEAVEEKYGVTPQEYPDLAALVGETSDNLPGVPGVGAKTAAQWINKFGGLKGILEHVDDIGGKRGEALRENLPDVKRNRRLNRLVDDLDLDVTMDQLRLQSADFDALDQLFDTLEFSTLRKRVYRVLGREVDTQRASAIASGMPELVMKEVTIASPETDVEAWLSSYASGTTALTFEGNGRVTEADLSVVGLYGNSHGLVFDATRLTLKQEEAVTAYLSGYPSLIIHGAKAAEHAFAARGWKLPPPVFDTQLAAYLARPDRRAYSFAEVVSQFLGEGTGGAEPATLFNTNDKEPAEHALLLARLEPVLRDVLNTQEALPLLEGMEIPMQTVLGQMERAGIAMDLRVLEELSQELHGNVERARSDAYAAIGHEANLSSPKQLQVILFEELGMPKTRKTKTGWTTDAEALQDLFARTGHPFLEALLRHRDSSKLMQMVDSLIGEVQPDGRIHTTFQQTVAGTGRIASSDPNLQNIPARSDTGLRVRGAFVAGDEYASLMSVDYSQIEMRIMAHLSEDQKLIDAFNMGEDLHRSMAAMVFDVPVDEVTAALRSRIKATSYGLAYGLSAYGLSKQLGIGVDEARQLRERYFERFGGVGRYLQEVVAQARDTGYTETMFGRRRYFPDLQSTNRRVVEMAERAALNAPIQGSAADIIKIATVEVNNRLQQGHYRSRLLLQIHDELLLEIAEGEREEVEQLAREAMASPVNMSVPLEVAVGVGHSWKDAAH